MVRTLTAARDEFIAAVNKENSGSDRARLIAVLDAVIAWSAARPKLLRFREDTRAGVVSFERTGTHTVFWTAASRTRNVPRLSLLSPTASSLDDGERAHAVDTINAHSRDELMADSPLSIGFGALKNPAARGAVLALMDRLLSGAGRPISATANTETCRSLS